MHRRQVILNTQQPAVDITTMDDDYYSYPAGLSDDGGTVSGTKTGNEQTAATEPRVRGHAFLGTAASISTQNTMLSTAAKNNSSRNRTGATENGRESYYAEGHPVLKAHTFQSTTIDLPILAPTSETAEQAQK